jgi:hypothetical protein
VARIDTSGFSGVLRPGWAVDYFHREHNLPGGARLDAGQFAADANGRRYVPSGTVLGRTVAERDAGTGFGPAVAGDDEIYILIHDVYDAARNPECELLRRGSGVKENFLPGFGGLAAGVQSALRAKYEFTVGVN